MVKVPDRYLEDTSYPSQVPQTFGECIYQAIPAWKAALDSANADKKGARNYQEEVSK